MATMTSHPVKTRVDDYFFTAMSVVILVTVVLGFARTYYLAGTFRAPLPSVLIHIHAVVFSSWVVLLIAQTSLVSASRIGWHRKLGVFGAVMIFVMAFVGLAAAIDSQRRHFAVPGLDSATTLAIQLSQLAVFAFLATWGIRSRRDGPAHKRLMLLATVALLGPAINRWPFAFVQNVPSTTGLIIDAFLLSVVALDLLTRRRLHRVTFMSGLLIFVMIPAMFALGRTGIWLRFTHWVQQ